MSRHAESIHPSFHLTDLRHVHFHCKFATICKQKGYTRKASMDNLDSRIFSLSPSPNLQTAGSVTVTCRSNFGLPPFACSLLVSESGSHWWVVFLLYLHSLLIATCDLGYGSAVFLYNLTTMKRQQSSELNIYLIEWSHEDQWLFRKQQ